MKTTLTIEQSAELIKRGVSADKASKRVTRQVADSRGREIEKLRLKRWKDCVPYEKATMTNLRVGLMHFEHQEIFTLADLLSLLPKKLYGEETDYCDCELHIHANKLGWSASYTEFRGSEIMMMKFTSYGIELIDALFSLVCKLIDNHVKLD